MPMKFPFFLMWSFSRCSPYLIVLKFHKNVPFCEALNFSVYKLVLSLSQSAYSSKIGDWQQWGPGSAQQPQCSGLALLTGMNQLESRIWRSLALLTLLQGTCFVQMSQVSTVQEPRMSRDTRGWALALLLASAVHKASLVLHGREIDFILGWEEMQNTLIFACSWDLSLCRLL